MAQTKIAAIKPIEKLKIDDPVGAVPVHMVNGAWGVLAVGIFANGNPDFIRSKMIQNKFFLLNNMTPNTETRIDPIKMIAKP